MSKQKKASEQETNQDPLADLIQPKAQPAKPSNGDDLAAMEQDLLQTSADSSLFDPETLAALSDLAEMEASLLLNPLAARPTAVSSATNETEPNRPDWLDEALYPEDSPILLEDEGLLELLDQATDALLTRPADDVFAAADLEQTAVLPQQPATDEANTEPLVTWEPAETSDDSRDEEMTTTVLTDEGKTAVFANSDTADDDLFTAPLPLPETHDDTEPLSALQATFTADLDEADALAALQAAETMLVPREDNVPQPPAAHLTDDETDALDALQLPDPHLADEADALAALTIDLSTDEADALAALHPAAPADYLHDIITTIDEEVEAVYGDSTVVDLSSEQLAAPLHNLRQYVVFMLAGERYAAPAHHVREVAQLTAVTRIPNVPTWLLGVTNLRGDVLSLIGLRTFLGLGANGSNGHSPDTPFAQGDSQVMVVHSEKYASNITTGLVVDEIQDIRYLDTDQIGTLSAPIEDQVAPFLQGVYEENGRLLVLLDLEKLLLSPAIWQFDQA